jgi:hypothetical protein
MNIPIPPYLGEAGFTRVAALVSYRFVDSSLYLGAIASVSFGGEGYYKHINGTTGRFTAGKTTYSAGLEAGAKFKKFLLGAEAGYLFADYGNPKDGEIEFNGGGQLLYLDLSGPYLKAVAGIHF